MYISLKDLQMLHHAFNIEFNVDQFKFRNHINKNTTKIAFSLMSIYFIGHTPYHVTTHIGNIKNIFYKF